MSIVAKVGLTYARVFAKGLLIIAVGYVNIVFTMMPIRLSPADHLDAPHPVLGVNLALFVALPLFFAFAYMFIRERRGWWLCLLLNILVLVISQMLRLPSPGA